MQNESFFKLHQRSKPFLLGNVWDVASALELQKYGFEALGTSSFAVAKHMGYEDGEQIPFDQLFDHITQIIKICKMPLTVDLERGYADNIDLCLENIRKIKALGAVGINLEDGRPNNEIAEIDHMVELITCIKNDHGCKDLFLNIRSDIFNLGFVDPVNLAIERLNAYQNAGCDGVFIPYTDDKTAILEVVQDSQVPINIMLDPNHANFSDYLSLGVKRISFGPFLYLLDHENRKNVVENQLSHLLQTSLKG